MAAPRGQTSLCLPLPLSILEVSISSSFIWLLLGALPAPPPPASLPRQATLSALLLLLLESPAVCRKKGFSVLSTAPLLSSHACFMLAAEIEGCPLSSFSICTSLHPQPTLTALLHAPVRFLQGLCRQGDSSRDGAWKSSPDLE